MGLPLSAKASASYERKDVNMNTNVNAFAKETNQTGPIGRLKGQKYVVMCQGNGTMSFDIIQSKIKRLEEMAKLHNNGILTDEEFQREKSKILGNDGEDSHSE